MAKSKLGRKAAYFSLHFHMAVQHGRLDRNLKKPLEEILTALCIPQLASLLSCTTQDYKPEVAPPTVSYYPLRK